MFTSRAEFRLSLRADNADQRLTPKAIEAGCVSEDRQAAFSDKMEKLGAGRDVLTRNLYSPQDLAGSGIKVSNDGSKRTLYDLLSFPDVGLAEVEVLDPEVTGLEAPIREQLAKDALYAKYIERQERDVAAMKRDEAEEIPSDFDFTSLEGLSNELKSKLVQFKPTNLAQAGRVEGMTPAALTLILARLRRAKSASLGKSA